MRGCRTADHKFKFRYFHALSITRHTRLSTLQAAGIQLIEWGYGLYGRMNVPLVFFSYSYVVGDACLEHACKILESLGLPPSSSWSPDIIGDAFRVTQFKFSDHAMHLVLYPTSFVDFTPSELVEAPPSHMSNPTCSAVWVPRPSAIYAFLLHDAVQRYPRFDRTRGTLCNDLGSLILYHLLGYTLEDMAEEEEEEEEQRCTCNAVGVIRKWGAQGEWRKGEEWFEDSLVDLVTSKAREEHLAAPDKPSPA